MMYGRPDFTVLIPTRCDSDRPAWGLLRRVVAAWLDQTLPPSRFEVVVLDRGSEPAVEHALDMNDERLRVVRLDGAGVCQAYNEGIEMAKGRYVFLGVDDSLPDPEVLRAHATAHSAVPESVVWSREIQLRVAEGSGSRPGIGEWTAELDQASTFTDLVRRCVINAAYQDIEDCIDAAFFQRSRVGWLAMRLGHQSVYATTLRRLGGLDEGLDPSGWYAEQDLGIRLKDAGAGMTVERRRCLVHVPHERVADLRDAEHEPFRHLFNKHRRPELLLLERYFRNGLTLRSLEAMVAALDLPERV